MENYDTILTEQINHIARITLNRVQVHNAFNPTMIEELTSVFKQLGNDLSIRAIILTGAGKSFSAGADLNYMKSTKDYSLEENQEDAFRLEQLFYTIYTTPKPVIARINGAAFGGGVGLICASDIAISVETAKMAFSEVNLGIMPAVISPYVIPKIGMANTTRYFLTGEIFNAIKAKTMGLIHETTKDHSELDKKIQEIINHIFSSSPLAMTAIKQLLVKNRDSDFQTVRKYCIEKIAEIRTSDEGKEGLNAFLEKRSPKWKIENW
ncbi:MAG: enoyl-CoA hydratase/isomerase family protein [Candidatus Heimdallarchaeota archaeon]|nr:enoyl-CoA hydratase/isomerase family protein [Candidatus Heimdallarchaeota archaeon]